MFIDASVYSWVDLKVDGYEFSTASSRNVYALSICPVTRALTRPLSTAPVSFTLCFPILGPLEVLAKQVDICLIVKCQLLTPIVILVLTVCKVLLKPSFNRISRSVLANVSPSAPNSDAYESSILGKFCGPQDTRDPVQPLRVDRYGAIRSRDNIPILSKFCTCESICWARAFSRSEIGILAGDRPSSHHVDDSIRNRAYTCHAWLPDRYVSV